MFTYPTVSTAHEQLVALGLDWASHRPTDDRRDVPSRRLAFELASRALGRTASLEEAMLVQRTAREALRDAHR